MLIVCRFLIPKNCWVLNLQCKSVRPQVWQVLLTGSTDTSVWKTKPPSALYPAVIALGYALNNLSKDDEIILNEAEHASNILPWYEVAKRINCKIIFAPLNEKGEVTLESIKKVVSNNTKLISIYIGGEVYCVTYIQNTPS